MWRTFRDTNLIGKYGTINCHSAWKTENRCTGMGKCLFYEIFIKISFKWVGKFKIDIYQSSSEMAIFSTFIGVNILILCMDLPVSAMETNSSGSTCILFTFYTNIQNNSYNIETILVIKVLLSFFQHLHQRLIYSNIEDDVEDVQSFLV